ncbi:MAG TPA: PIN domain-containing protein [Dermatophilaceae bacterium]|nr:PIN domain-containing protein [Dermatophilaceae bacterium]
MTAANPVATCDTSLLIAALLQWHPRHQVARAALRTRVQALPAHVVVECFSVLTRLPAPHRLSAADSGAALAGLRLPLLTLPADGHLRLVQDLARAGIRGGATYDGLVAATARHHDATLLTADRRARATYEAVGARVGML